MIRLALHLSFGSGRDALVRVLVVAAAVALGVGLLLCALAASNGLRAQTDRGAWLDTPGQTAASRGPGGTSPSTPSTQGAGGLWWLSSVDQYGNQVIDRVDVAAAGPGAPVPPGLRQLPGPGEYDASPALSALLRSLPANELRDRYRGHQIGIIGPAALPSPSSLVIVIGSTAAHLSRVPGAVEVRSILRTAASCYDCQSSVGSGPILQWILAGGAVALVLPVLILIATASRLSAASREQRFAAMRLVGATPRQMSILSTLEATVAAVAGVVAGFALFVGFRPMLARVPFAGAPFAPGDLSLSALDVVLVVIGVPVAAAVTGHLSLRRATRSPLGVSRRAASARPRAIRIIPLLAGVAMLAYFDGAGKPASNGGQIFELLAGFVLLIAGLVLAGPWLTTAGSRVVANRARRPAALIAGRRLLDNPRTAFRFVSGLVIALFVTSAVIGALSSIVAASGVRAGGAGTGTLADVFCTFSTTHCPASTGVPSVPGRVLNDLRTTRGVRAVTVVHQAPPSVPQRSTVGVVACDQLVKTPAIGTCAPGTAVATIGSFLSNILGANSHASTTTWPAAHLSGADVATLPVSAVVLVTNGSPSSIERARTSLERAFPSQGEAVAVDKLGPSTWRVLAMIQDMTDVVIVASLVIAACSLAVNVAAGLGERKRPFSLLRLAGVPVRILHRVVALESALPLVLVAAVAIVVGLLSAALYLRSQVDIAFRMPGFAYWGTVVGALAASLAIIVATFPLLDRVTGPEVARNE